MKDELIFLGPRCDYNANIATCPTGQTWQELEAEREYNRTLIQQNKAAERNALNLEPLPIEPYQQYAHPYLAGKALEDIVKQLSKKTRIKL